MEVVAKSNSKRMYSWWWDSHNTPKNSKWLHHNLADMDSNVKKMIKVLEEDADSFAMRAEMYYRKRPELMNLVEEFYRAYRALAERYNHATGVIHKAHQTISEALPNQVPIIFGDQSHAGEGDPQEPNMLPPIRARVDPDERANKVEAETLALKQSLAKAETDKEAALVQYRQGLKTISKLEDEVGKLKFYEEKCVVLERSNQNLHSELDGLLEKLRNQSQKITEKQTELVKLWSRVQEEHLRFHEAETAFQTLQKLHSQSQEELQTRSRIMNDMEIRNNELHEELEQAKVENKDLNLSSVASVKSLQEDVSSLKETIQKLEAEVESRVDRESQAATFVCDKEISALHETLITATTHEQAEACNNLEKLKRSQAVVLLNEGIKSLEDYVFVDREDKLSKVADSNDEFPKLEDMCLRIKAIAEAIMKKEKLLMLDNSNAYSMLEEALKQVKELKTGGGRSMRKQGGGSIQTRKQSHEFDIITKDIVLDQTSDGSSYEIISKKGDLEFDNHSFFELKPVKTETTVKAKGKSLSEESLIVDKLEIFDGFMDPNIEVNKRKVIERLRSDLKKLENLQITVKDLKNKVETEDEYATIKGQVEEAEEAIEKLFNVNQKLTRKAESEKIGRVSEHARRGSEKIGRLQLEIQRIQFLLMKLQGEKENRVRSKISDTSSKVLLRDYIYGGSRSVTMKKKTTKKRSAFCGCAQQPPSP